MCDVLNTWFKPENVIEKVQDITSKIHTENLRDRERWQDTMLYVKQDQRVDSLILFANQRPSFLKENMISFFKIEGEVEKIKVFTDKSEGSVKVNKIIVDEDWQGDYIGSIPLEITAIPTNGYQFVRWKNRKWVSSLL